MADRMSMARQHMARQHMARQHMWPLSQEWGVTAPGHGEGGNAAEAVI